MRMLQKMGWSQGEGLGKAGDGEVDPIKVSVKLDRKGLVSEWDAVSLAVEEVQHTEAEAGEDVAINMTIHNKLYNSDFCVLAGTGLIDWDNLNSNREENERERWKHLPPLLKDFYSEHPDVTARSEEEVAEFRRRSNNIEVSNFQEDDDT